jgi:putative DNA primase/helicase
MDARATDELVAEYRAARLQVDASVEMLARGLDLLELLRCGLDLDEMVAEVDAFRREVVETEGAAMSNVLPFSEEEPRPPAFSEESLALRFADQHADDLRYVDLWGKWLLWDGRRWAPDDTRKSFDCSRSICRAASAECNKHASQLASAKTVVAVLSLARADRRLAATIDQWDADPWMLHTPGGIVDLTVGSGRKCLPQDYMTKMTTVAAGGTCPHFLSFLEGDHWRRRHPFRVPTAHVRLLHHGVDARAWPVLFVRHRSHGKSVLLNTVAGILGDYHRTAPIETFTASSVDRHPTELASLQGRRLVTATETEEGRRWAESRIKALTGGDKIAARFMRADFFEFTPAFKLVIAGNHKPGLAPLTKQFGAGFISCRSPSPSPSTNETPTLLTSCARNGLASWPG